MEGFEAFELLRPTDGKDVFYVYTRWRSTEDFDRWLNSQAFGQGHAQHTEQGPVEHGERPARVRRGPRGVRVTASRPADRSAIAQLTGAGRRRSRSSSKTSSVIRCRSTSSACVAARADGAERGARRRRLGRAGGPAVHLRRARPPRARARRIRSRELGVQRGDRVALVSANVPEWVITWWACAILGATLVPLNAWWKAEELEFGLERLRGEGAHRRRPAHRDRARPPRRAARARARLRDRRPGDHRCGRSPS